VTSPKLLAAVATPLEDEDGGGGGAKKYTPENMTHTPSTNPPTPRCKNAGCMNSRKKIPPLRVAKKVQNTCSTGMMNKGSNRARASFIR
jgi:hypothetical protein